MEYAGRTCYRSAQTIAPDSAPAFVARLIAREHLSPLEFAGMTVELTTSRDVMAELTRAPAVQLLRGKPALRGRRRRYPVYPPGKHPPGHRSL